MVSHEINDTSAQASPVPMPYERGFVDVAKYRVSGHGVIALSSDINLEEHPVEGSMDHKSRSFFCR